MTGKRADTLLSMMLFIERFTLHRAWDDLTDDELHWEPLAGSWGVHTVSDVPTATPFVNGEWAVDFDADVAWAAAEICVLRDIYRLTNGAGPARS